jgi:hypothetical protein
MPKKNEGRTQNFHSLLGPPFPSEKITLLFLAELKESFAYQDYYKELEQDPFTKWPQLRRDDEMEVHNDKPDPWIDRLFTLTSEDKADFRAFTSRFDLNSLWLEHIQDPSGKIIDDVAEKIINDERLYSFIFWNKIGPSGREVLRWLDPNTDIKEAAVDEESTLLLSTLFAVRGVVGVSPDNVNKIKTLPYEWYLKIDLRKPKSVLLAESERLIDSFLHRRAEYEELIEKTSRDRLIEAGILGPYDLGLGEGEYQWDVDNTRLNFEKRLSQLRVWRMRKQRKPFKEIAVTLNENMDTIRKQYYAAYERYQGGPYDREVFRKAAFKPISREKIMEICNQCPSETECFNKTGEPKAKMDPCPNFIYLYNYLNEDQKHSSSEKLLGDEHDLVMSHLEDPNVPKDPDDIDDPA